MDHDFMKKPFLGAGALKSKALLEDMSARGIKYVDCYGVDCYGVDNALVHVADPTFLGYFIDKGVSSAAKVVRKAYPQENVGVFVQRGHGGPLSVVEYSEMDVAMTTEINQSTGRLRYCWSNASRSLHSAPTPVKTLRRSAAGGRSLHPARFHSKRNSKS